jgi:G3E family GTPase
MTVDGANEFIRKIMMEKGANIYRMKGFIAMEDHPMKFVFHSVGMLFSIEPFVAWKKEEKRHCIFVIIGKHLN